MEFDSSSFLKGMHAGAERIRAAAKRGVDLFGEQVIGNAQELAPVATGALKASGTTEPATIDQSGITKMIGFNTDYAAAVHENLNAKHDQGQAKYLSSAMSHLSAKFASFVADVIKSEVGD